MRKIKVKNYSDVYIGEYPFHKQLKDELIPLLENYPDIQGRKTNVIATMTEWKWQQDNPRIKRLKECACAELRFHPVIRHIEGKNQQQCNLFFKQLWANVYDKGDYTNSHGHQMYETGFGFVYFLKSKWYHPSFIFTDSGKKIRPKEGTYLLFPYHLYHHVPKNRFKETRITLSGNIDVTNPLIAKES